MWRCEDEDELMMLVGWRKMLLWQWTCPSFESLLEESEVAGDPVQGV